MIYHLCQGHNFSIIPYHLIKGVILVSAVVLFGHFQS